MDARVAQAPHGVAAKLARVNPLIDDRDVEFMLDEVLDLAALARSRTSRITIARPSIWCSASRARARARRAVPGVSRARRRAAALVDGTRHGASRAARAVRRGSSSSALDRGAAPARGRRRSSCRSPCARSRRAYLMAGEPVGVRLRRPDPGRRAPARGVRQRRAARDVHGAACTRRVDRHDGADRAAGRLEPRRRHDARDADARRHYSIRGAKIFISGGDHDLTENIVHLTLARIDGAPPGIKGVSLFCVPKRRVEGGALVDNDVASPALIHKIGWRGLPSIALELRRARRLPRLARRRAAPGHPLHVPDDERGAHHGRPQRRRDGVGRVPRGARVRARRARRAAPLAARDPAAPQVADHRARRRAPHAAAPEGDRRGRRSRSVARRALLRRPRRARDDADARARAAAARSADAGREERSPPSAASRPTRSRCRSTAATATRASTCPRRGCAIRSSTPSTRARPASRRADLLGRRAVAKGGAALVALGREIAKACERAREANLIADRHAAGHSTDRVDPRGSRRSSTPCAASAR